MPDPVDPPERPPKAGPDPPPDIQRLKDELDEPLERLEAIREELLSLSRPVSPLRQQLQKRIGDMNFPAPAREKLTPDVARLTVRDLNDLASAFVGVEVHNPSVARLTVDDIRTIEEVFGDFKQSALTQVGGVFTRPGDELSLSVSCCCTTPCCCCCAAAELDPFV